MQMWQGVSFGVGALFSLSGLVQGETNMKPTMGGSPNSEAPRPEEAPHTVLVRIGIGFSWHDHSLHMFGHLAWSPYRDSDPPKT